MTQRQANILIVFVAIAASIVVAIYLVSETDVLGDRIGSTENEMGSTETPTAIPADDNDQLTPDPDPSPDQTPTPELAALSGEVTNVETGEPLSGVSVEALQDGEVVSSAQTGEDGRFTIVNLPPESVLSFSLAGFAHVEEQLAGQTQFNVEMHPSLFVGRVVTEAGEPIFDATVAAGDVILSTAEDGSFELDVQDATVDIVFKAPGYAARVLTGSELQPEIALSDKPIRGVYVTAGTAGNDERFGELLDLVDRTELNAMVIDIKDSAGFVFHNTGVEMAHEIDAVRPAYNVEDVLRRVKERDIYAIARIVIFEDPVLANARHDLAIQDTERGGLWETWTGLTWANPFMEEVWEYNIALMLEAVELGFDEIQLDYMRFPSDGPLNRAGYGQESTPESRDRTIGAFLDRVYEAIGPTPAYVTGDIFGLTMWDPGESDIGQNLVTVADRLDYIHPMIYPSHFYEGSMGFDVPNDHPYEVIQLSLENGMQFLPEHYKPKIRPWLQDFSYGVGIDYGADEVRAQIQASRDFGASGWMLWNASNVYHEEAID